MNSSGTSTKIERRMDNILKRFSETISGLETELKTLEGFADHIFGPTIQPPDEKPKLLEDSGVIVDALEIRLQRINNAYGILLSLNKRLMEF